VLTTMVSAWFLTNKRRVIVKHIWLLVSSQYKKTHPKAWGKGAPHLCHLYAILRQPINHFFSINRKRGSEF
jgi:hypothetical protein